MEVLGSYQDLIEADPNDISICWKISQISFYFLTASASYGSAILFYILWYEIFGGNCPLWAQTVSPMQPRLIKDENDIPVIEEPPPPPIVVTKPDWRQKILVTFTYTTRCKVYHFVSLCSCLFGIALLMLFAMCGKGGYDTRIFAAPWRVVPPAIAFQIVFVILTMFIVNDMEYGYFHFAHSLERVASRINDTELAADKRQCDFVQHYLQVFGTNQYSVCQVYPALRILSWIMAWSWVLGLIILILRVIKAYDFKVLTITIYSIPKSNIHYS